MRTGFPAFSSLPEKMAAACYGVFSVCSLLLLLMSSYRDATVQGQKCRDKPLAVSAGETSCPSGCKFGYGTKKDDTEKCSTKTIAGKGKCTGPKVETRHGRQSSCQKCPKVKFDGPFCSRQNLAYRKNHGDDALIDEDITTCAPWNKSQKFRVSLKKIFQHVQLIAIFLKNKTGGSKDLRTCEVILKDKTKIDRQNELCSSIERGPAGDVQHFWCPKQGDTIVVDCSSSQLVPPQLCEVKAYGCRQFWFGVKEECREPCNCNNGFQCDKVTGSCKNVKGCARGWEGENCTEKTPDTEPSTVASSTPTESSPLDESTREPSSHPPSLVSFTPFSLHPSTLSTRDEDSTSSHHPHPAHSAVSDGSGLTAAAAGVTESDQGASLSGKDSSTLGGELQESTESSFPSELDSTEKQLFVSTDVLPVSNSTEGSIDALPVSNSTESSSGALPFSNTTNPSTDAPSVTNSTESSTDAPPVTNSTESSTDAPPVTNSTESSTDAPPVTNSTGSSTDALPISTSSSDVLPITTSAQASTDALSVSIHTAETTSADVTAVTTSAPTSSLSTSLLYTASTKGLGGRESVTPDKVREGEGGGKDEQNTVFLVLFAVVALLSLVVLIAALLWRRRHKQGQSSGLKTGGSVPYENVTDQELVENAVGRGETSPSKQETSCISVSETFQVTLEPVPVELFTSHLTHLVKMGALELEFKELPQGPQSCCTAADAVNEGQVKKNRFRNISPYDSNRVMLVGEGESGSDYINASYIDGFAESNAYIAAQGPLSETVGDFWHMVWTEGCCKIVMLTNLCEGSKVKCEQYWPQQQGTRVTHGAYAITSVKVTERAHFIHRLLTVSKATNKGGGEEREVHHLHFTAWPDHGAPCTVALVQFWAFVHRQAALFQGPLLVHCSAGIGRTGTFIALDMLTQQAETTSKVSVYPTVRRLRKQRINMVQTAVQYRFLHEALNEWLCSRDTFLVKDDVMHGHQWAQDAASGTMPESLAASAASQYQLLQSMRPSPSTEEMKTALLEENTHKNRANHILPVEASRVRLWANDDSESDYINAAFVPSLLRAQGLVVTQLPPEGCVADFWRLVMDWRVKVVVRVDDAAENQSVALYPEEHCEARHGDITVHTDSLNTLTLGLDVLRVELNRKLTTDEGVIESGWGLTLYCLQPGKQGFPGSAGPCERVMEAVLPHLTTSAQPPIVLQCCDGASVSGVLCCLLMTLEALETEDRASPFLAARLLHTARPQALTSQEQYEFVFRCVLHRYRGLPAKEGEPDHSAATHPKKDVSEETPIMDQEHIYGNA